MKNEKTKWDKNDSKKKRKKDINETKEKFFDKLPKYTILNLLSLFTGSEQILLLTLNNKFKGAFCAINSINQKNAKNEIKYLYLLNKLKNLSKNFSPYLNALLNMNIINLNEEFLGLKFYDNNKYNLFKIFMENIYQETNENKILIQINKKEDFNIYYSVLNLIKNEIREQFNYDIDISILINIKENTDIILKLFNLITFKNVKLSNIKNKNNFIEIHNYFMENNIKTYHKYI